MNTIFAANQKKCFYCGSPITRKKRQKKGKQQYKCAVCGKQFLGGERLNIRKGIYTKEDYKSEELACLLYTPTYISLGYVLQRSGITFQYDSAITNISCLNREISVNGQSIQYRQIKREILFNTSGIINKNNSVISRNEGNDETKFTEGNPSTKSMRRKTGCVSFLLRLLPENKVYMENIHH